MKRQENGESCTMRSFIFCTHPPDIIRQIKSRRKVDGGFCLYRRGEENVQGFWWESPKERDHLEDQVVDGRMGLEWILGRLAEGIKWIRPVWWPGLNNSPTVTHACRKKRLKWVPSVWGDSSVTLSPGVISTEAWSSRLGVGRWTNNPAL
jgi:hypothetical protein